MDTRMLKYVSIPLIAVVNFLAGFLPYLLISRRLRHHRDSKIAHNPSHVSSKLQHFLSMANFFCGGVFLATCLVGLYPSVTEKFIKIAAKNPNLLHFPWEALTITVGFFLVWILEVLVHCCIHCHSSSQQPLPVYEPDQKSPNSAKNSEEHGTLNSDNNNPVASKVKEKLIDTDQMVFDDGGGAGDKGGGHGDGHHHSHQPQHQHHHHSDEEEEEDQHGDGHSHMPITGNLLGSVMLTFALGSHSIIEGLGFAMIEKFGMTLNMLITVLIHESVCAFSLGVNLAGKYTPVKVAVILIGTFSILIPAGLGIGMILLNAEVNDLVTAILQGIAAGTFLYVVFMEILTHDHSNQSNQLINIFVMMLGFAVISGLKVFHSASEAPSNSTSLSHTTLKPSLSRPTSLP